MSVVYDAGVLVAADRDERAVWAEHRMRLELGLVPVVTAPVIAQASRSPRQVQLRRFLQGCEIVRFAAEDAHEVGGLLAASRSSDVVDAHVVLIASRRAMPVLTSDPRDLRRIAAHATAPVAVRTLPR